MGTNDENVNTESDTGDRNSHVAGDGLAAGASAGDDTSQDNYNCANGYPDWNKSPRYLAALAFAQNGIPIFPCLPGAKQPRYAGSSKTQRPIRPRSIGGGSRRITIRRLSPKRLAGSSLTLMAKKARPVGPSYVTSMADRSKLARS
jgi:hypothetical protein